MTGWLEARMNLPQPTPAGWLRVVLRGTVLGTLVSGGLVLLLVLRLFEAPLFRPHRPLTPFVTQGVCRLALTILGIRLMISGRPMAGRGAVVANHASWLDIFVLNAVDRVYFVSKAEVAGWPGIGWLAQATGTVFITRSGAEAKAQQNLFEARLRAGHRLLFFPEGTSTDGLRVLPFKSTLFAAFFMHHLNEVLQIQPVSVRYLSPPGTDARLYGWWGDMGFAPHLLMLLAAPRAGGSVAVLLHPPLAIRDFPDRKALAARAEAMVRAGHDGAGHDGAGHDGAGHDGAAPPG